MSWLLSVERNPCGPRLRVCGGKRVHHWHCGMAMVATGLRRRDPLLVAFGMRTVWRDRGDLIDALLGVA